MRQSASGILDKSSQSSGLARPTITTMLAAMIASIIRNQRFVLAQFRPAEAWKGEILQRALRGCSARELQLGIVIVLVSPPRGHVLLGRIENLTSLWCRKMTKMIAFVGPRARRLFESKSELSAAGVSLIERANTTCLHSHKPSFICSGWRLFPGRRAHLGGGPFGAVRKAPLTSAHNACMKRS